jgi:hypothetical protein
VALLVGWANGSDGVGMEILSVAEDEGMASSMRAQVK